MAALDHGDDTAPVATSLEWLGWDGSVLRWTVTLAAPAQLELRIDGIVFERHALGTGEHALHSRFACSPTGNYELEFSLAFAAATRTLGKAWRVRFDAAAAAGIDHWTRAPPHLAPLAETPSLPARSIAALPSVAVIVPIFNAIDSVRRCLAAIEQWTAASARLILVDDASTDPAIAPALAEFAVRRGNAEVRSHPHNLGFTSAINTGIAAAGNADVVLLNSDTEVGPRWLPSLRLAAYGDEHIGTVTAVSDNAGAFSVPELEQYCPIPARWDLPTAQRAVLQQAGMRFPELPTGNGFCLFVKRAVIDRIGVMDAQAFPSGYGEENDFCQRAIRAGYRNIIAGHVLVRHERSASFGDDRRAALGAQGMAVLRQRYPDYEAEVGANLPGFARRVLDYRVRRTYADSDGRYAAAPPRPRVLVVTTNDEQAHAQLANLLPQHEVFLLSAEQPLRLRRFASEGDAVVEATLDQANRSFEEGIRAWLLAYAIENVLATTATSFAADVRALAADLDIASLQAT